MKKGERLPDEVLEQVSGLLKERFADPIHVARAVLYAVTQPIDINIEEVVVRPPKALNLAPSAIEAVGGPLPAAFGRATPHLRLPPEPGRVSGLLVVRSTSLAGMRRSPVGNRTNFTPVPGSRSSRAIQFLTVVSETPIALVNWARR